MTGRLEACDRLAGQEHPLKQKAGLFYIESRENKTKRIGVLKVWNF